MRNYKKLHSSFATYSNKNDKSWVSCQKRRCSSTHVKINTGVFATFKYVQQFDTCNLWIRATISTFPTLFYLKHFNIFKTSIPATRLSAYMQQFRHLQQFNACSNSVVASVDILDVLACCKCWYVASIDTLWMLACCKCWHVASVDTLEVLVCCKCWSTRKQIASVAV